MSIKLSFLCIDFIFMRWYNIYVPLKTYTGGEKLAMEINITVTPQNTTEFPLHSHEVWELMCYTDGAGYLLCGNEKLPFESGTVIAVPPGIVHGSKGESSFSNICIHADISMHENKVYRLSRGSEQQTALFEIIKSIYFDKSGEIVLPNLIMALKDLICAEASPGISQAEKVCRAISQNCYSDKFDVSQAIKETGYADDFFRTVFKEKYGVTPRQYLEKLRIEYACRLIKTYRNALSVGYIAHLSGFRDPLYFSRRFKKMIGISPKNYITGETENEKN